MPSLLLKGRQQGVSVRNQRELVAFPDFIE